MNSVDILKFISQIEKLNDLITHTESLITETESPDIFLRWISFKVLLLYDILTHLKVLERNEKKCPVCGAEIEEI